MPATEPPLTAPRRRLAASERRQQILHSSARLFIAHGFEAVSMADIAADLQISRPATYSYFHSTEGILGALLDERLGQLWSHLERLISGTQAVSRQPPAGVYAALFDFLLTERDSLQLLHSGGGPNFQARRAAFLNELGQRLEVRFPSIRRRAYQMTVVTHLLDSLAFHAVQQGMNDVSGLAQTLDTFMRGGVQLLAEEGEETGSPLSG